MTGLDKQRLITEINGIKGVMGTTSAVFENNSPEEIVHHKEAIMQSDQVDVTDLTGQNEASLPLNSMKWMWAAIGLLALYVVYQFHLK